MTTAFKSGDIVLYEGWAYIFRHYIGKTGKMAEISRVERRNDGYPVRRVFVKSLSNANEVLAP